MLLDCACAEGTTRIPLLHPFGGWSDRSIRCTSTGRSTPSAHSRRPAMKVAPTCSSICGSERCRHAHHCSWHWQLQRQLLSQPRWHARSVHVGRVRVRACRYAYTEWGLSLNTVQAWGLGRKGCRGWEMLCGHCVFKLSAVTHMCADLAKVAQLHTRMLASGSSKKPDKAPWGSGLNDHGLLTVHEFAYLTCQAVDLHQVARQLCQF